VPQGQQTHAALGGAVKALEELFPGFTKDLVEAGAVSASTFTSLARPVGNKIASNRIWSGHLSRGRHLNLLPLKKSRMSS
jgi:hypothetical protein